MNLIVVLIMLLFIIVLRLFNEEGEELIFIKCSLRFRKLSVNKCFILSGSLSKYAVKLSILNPRVSKLRLSDLEYLN